MEVEFDLDITNDTDLRYGCLTYRYLQFEIMLILSVAHNWYSCSLCAV